MDREKENAFQQSPWRISRFSLLVSGSQFCFCPEIGESRAQSWKCQPQTREHSPDFLSLLRASGTAERQDGCWTGPVLSNVATVVARNQAVSWQASPCYSVLSASDERGISFTKERPALSMCLMNSRSLQRGCWYRCQLTPFVMYTNYYRVFTQAKQHVDFQLLLS